MAYLDYPGLQRFKGKLDIDMGDTRNAFTYITGLTPYYFIRGGYYTTPDTGGTPTFTENENWAYAIIPVTPGSTTIVLDAKGLSGNQRLYVYIDADGKTTSRSAANLSGVRTLTPSTDTIKFVIINNQVSSYPNFYAFTGGLSLSAQLDRSVMSRRNTDVSDLDTLLQTGFYTWPTSGHPANCPADVSGKAFELIVQTAQDTNTRSIQVIYPLTSIAAECRILYRIRNSSGWQTWQTVSTVTDMPQYWCYGKKINWIGDSIVNGGDFDERVTAALGMVETDYGVSGSTIALKGDGTDGRDAIVARYSNMSDNADIIAVSAGSNDFQYAWCPIGDLSSTENTTFYGAMKNLCEGLINKYPDKVIFFTTPIKRAQAFTNGDGGTYTEDNVATDPFSKNKYGKTLMDYCDIIKEVCGYYSIPVLDMNRESILNPNLSSQASLFSDDTHPSDAGKDIMARRVAGWMTQLAYTIDY